MIDWLSEHIQVIIVVSGVIAYWLNQRHRAKLGLPADYDEDGVPENKPTRAEFDPAQMESEEAERTRRVMEELRRKRAARLGGTPEAPVAPVAQPAPVRRLDAPPPVFEDPMAQMMKELAKRFAPPVEQQSAVDEQMLARQRELEEKLSALDAEKNAVLKRAAELRAQTLISAEESRAAEQAGVSSWMTSLHDQTAIRRAIVMNEILGKPVGLR